MLTISCGSKLEIGGAPFPGGAPKKLVHPWVGKKWPKYTTRIGSDRAAFSYRAGPGMRPGRDRSGLSPGARWILNTIYKKTKS